MHASIEQLLDLREGIAVDAAMKQHVGTCRRCSDVLTELSDVQKSLGSLPQQQAPHDGWSRIEKRLERQNAKPVWQLAAVAASVFAVVLTAFWFQSVQTPEPSVARVEVPNEPKPLAQVEAETGINVLVEQSRQLEQLLRELDGPRVMTAGTAGTIAGLQEGIAVIDYGLSSQAQLSPDQSQQLWRQRVGLMNSLVQVRSAQLQQISN